MRDIRRKLVEATVPSVVIALVLVLAVSFTAKPAEAG
jgi:hypothetical protein